jgi:outer membrane protein OmpA-like peptidoglycan-associated protein
MRKGYLCIIVTVLCLIWFTNAPAQDGLGLEVGLGIGAAYGLNESEDNEFKPHFKGVLGTTWSYRMQAEIGLGYAQIGDPDWDTDLIPVDVRLKVSPFGNDRIYPYLFAGFGALFYEVKTMPPNSPPNKDITDLTGIIPLGIGLQYYFSETLSLDVNGGYNYSFSDVLNPLNSEDDDSYLSFTVGLKYMVVSGDKDKDDDGIENKDEKILGTDFKNPDTDGDGLNDGEEINQTMTSPLNPDSDADELSDYEELKTTMTDPNNYDSDGDGLSDYDELKTHMTNPNVADSDNDGLSDADEIMTHMTDPNSTDSDADGLSDADEINTTMTNPNMVDTDEGGITDFDEVERGTDPLNDVDDFEEEEMLIVEEGAPIVLEGIAFASGKSDLEPGSEDILTKALNTMIAYPQMEVRVEGYTDNTGRRSTNMRLSQARADAVRDWLIEHGIAPERLAAIGLGPDNPIAPNDTREGRAQNRRIEFVRIDTEE